MTSRYRAAALLLLGAANAWAGRPLSTEDASILEAGRCQVEAWIDRRDDATTGWFVPACNLGFNTELQVGFARTRVEGQSRFSDAYAQAKTILREMTEHEPWGVGLVVGVIKQPLNEVHRGWDNPYVLVPFTQAICNTPLTFHANLGWARNRETKRDITLWGAALEAAVSERFTLVGEAYGENSERPFVRLGGRWSVLPGKFDVDLTYVARPGGVKEERFISLGVTWMSGEI